MPKKPTSAATMRARKAVLAFVAKLLRETAAAMDKAEGAQARYQLLAERLAGHDSRLKALDRKADARLLQAISDGARDVAAALLQNRHTGGAPSEAAARQAAQGLDRLSDAFLSGAGSLHLLPAKSKSTKSKINARIEGLHKEAADLARDYHVQALAFRETAGLEQPADRLTFRLPELADCGGGEKGGCGCGGSRVLLPGPPGLPPLPSSRQGAALSGGKPDLLLLTGALDRTGRLTATHLKGLAGLFTLSLFSASTLCIDSCAPVGVVRVTFIMASCRMGTGGDYYPMLGFSWVLCCACPCYYVLTEQRRETIEQWGQVTVLDPKPTRAAATNEAARRGREMASDYNAALTAGNAYKQPSDITPDLEPLKCFCWT